MDYPFLDKAVTGFLVNYETVHVSRIIDGDTIIGNNESIRLLGINTPERGEKYYSEAKEFLESLILNKTVQLKFGKDKKDRYNRTLAYIFLGNKNINLEIVENGFANYYFPEGKDAYHKSFQEVWKRCLEKEINLCEISVNPCSQCIELKELNVKSQEIIFHNKCAFQCDLTNWEIKDEGRKKFVFPDFVLNGNDKITIKVGEGTNNNEILFWKDETYVWTKTGDTLFLRDEEGKLVLW
ncbi:MAG: thermonuclease family protein, partial [Nanoarchaeota archaeon]